MNKISSIHDMMGICDAGLQQVHVIECDDALMIDCPSGEIKEIVYAEGDAEGDIDGCLVVNDSTIQKAYAAVEDGYGGEGCYWALAKVADKWWELDVVSEGVAYEMVGMTDEQAAAAVASYIK